MGLKDLFKRNVKKPALRLSNRGQYKIIEGHSHTISPSSKDDRCEDEVLDFNKRAKLLDVTRNLVRNSSVMNTLLGQITTRTIATTGGKVILNFPDEQKNKLMMGYFSSWTRNCEFYHSQSFNSLLKRILRETIIAGDCVLVYDDGVVENSGKVLIFESEEIVGCDEYVIEREYGVGSYWQNGKVYSPNGRWIGTIVSRSERGKEKANPSQCWFLKRDPNGNPLESNWYQPQSLYRNGRAISQAASIVGTIHQLSDLVESELMAARRGAQIFAFLQQSSQPQQMMPSTFGEDDDIENMSDEDLAQIAKQEQEATPTIDLSRAREASVEFCALPDGVQANQLDTKHPNDSVKTMVEWLSTQCASVLGISRVFINGDPTNGDFRANQLYSYAAIVEFQKFIEGVCDWAFFQTMKFNKCTLTIDDMSAVSWDWPTMDDLDEVSHQNAISLKFRNHLTTLKDELGNNWKETIQQLKEESKYFRSIGMIHPSETLLSGGQSAESEAMVE